MTGFFSSPPALVWPDQSDARLWPPCEEPVDSEEVSCTAQTQVQDRIIDLPQQQQTLVVLAVPVTVEDVEAVDVREVRERGAGAPTTRARGGGVIG